MFGQGDKDTNIVFISDAVGPIECDSGIPFSGKSKTIFDKALAANGLSRDRIYATSCLKCSIAGFKSIEEQWFAKCSVHLIDQLEIIKPKIICTMGPRSTKALLRAYNREEINEKFSDLRGNPILIMPKGKIVKRKRIMNPSFKFYLVPTENPALVDNLSIELAIINDLYIVKYIDNLKTLLF